MTKVVRSQDGRSWTVQSTINWSPAEEEQFENDMAAGQVPGIAMLGLVVGAMLWVLFWTPPGVVVPAWLVLLLPLLLMIVAIHWALRRPWTIEATAEPTPNEPTGEYWRGLTHGAMSARQDTQRVARCLEARDTPDDGTGLLQKVP
ncbi:MAG: DUF983 domain-containing protein [Pseudonocardiaceae bacterium]